MKIIFVDDDQLLLNAIKRSLFDSPWELLFACGGVKALEVLRGNNVDVIVSDMCMPEMDGSELLQEIYRLYPHVVRIVLSGHADQKVSLRTSFIAHQWLDKPCSQEILLNTLTDLQLGLADLPNLEVKLAVGQARTIPSPPRTFIKLRAKLSEANVNVDEVVKIISEDAGLTLKLLQLTNSAFFLRGDKIETVKQAVVNLGYELVANIVLLTASYSKLPAKNFLDVNEEQLHGLAVSKIAVAMVPEYLHDTVRLAGLLHEIGKYILVLTFPEKRDEYTTILKDKNIEDITVLERGVFNADHAQIGGYLLLVWGFPQAVVDGVLYHHNQKKIMSEKFGVAAAIYLADLLILGLHPPSEFVEKFDIKNDILNWQLLCETLSQESE